MTYNPVKRKISKRPNYDYPYPDDGGTYSPNLNSVCIDCREAKRFNSRGEIPNCPKCGKKMYNIFCKVEIPRKTNASGWKKLSKQIKKGSV